MSTAGSAALLARVLRRTGLSFPRGVLCEEVAALAAAMDDGDPEALGGMVDAAAAAMWPALRPSVEAALRMHLRRADDDDARDLETALVWAARTDSGNPLARGLVVRAARDLAGDLRRSARLLADVESVVAAGGRDAAVAAARAVGEAAVALLELDPEDFADEIAAYVDAGEDASALDALCRGTGDPEVRAWARAAVATLTASEAPAATAAAHGLAAGPPPDDAADDAVWVPVMLALVEEAFTRMLTEPDGDRKGA